MLADQFLMQINSANFEEIALQTFERQYKQIPIYNQYVNSLGRSNPKTLSQITFLPIEFFKSHKVLPTNAQIQRTFLSSGTTQQIRSKHHVSDLSFYESSLILGFERIFGSVKDFVFIGLLPSYLQNGDSSLIYMVDCLIKKSGTDLSGYYLDHKQNVLEVYQKALLSNKKPFVFGVSYALLDLSQQEINLSEAIILETGGMKGRRQELSKTVLHQKLQKGLQVPRIYSEYGMTELLSQAYCIDGTLFKCPPWMQIRLRDAYDPFSEVSIGQKGGINVIDLANQNSCSFIQTDDLGRLHSDGFSLEGRLAASDIRGCNLLVD